MCPGGTKKHVLRFDLTRLSVVCRSGIRGRRSPSQIAVKSFKRMPPKALGAVLLFKPKQPHNPPEPLGTSLGDPPGGSPQGAPPGDPSQKDPYETRPDLLGLTLLDVARRFSTLLGASRLGLVLLDSPHRELKPRLRSSASPSVVATRPSRPDPTSGSGLVGSGGVW